MEILYSLRQVFLNFQVQTPEFVRLL